MNNEFEENRYKLIDLNLGFEDLMVKSFKESIRVNNVQPEPVIGIEKSSDVFPFPLDVGMENLTSIVHRDYTTPIVEKEIDLKLIPTYCYTRKYFKGSMMRLHKDRDACEISLTYCLSGPEWEINMGDNTLITKKGNGVIYRGSEVKHGRLRPSSGEVIQVFNHWVVLDGTKSKSAYDEGKFKSFYMGC
jgi:hypothetical protein